MSILSALTGASHPFTSAVILAAGSSTRFGSRLKQHCELGSVPVIVRTLKMFQSSPLIDEIILVGRSEDIPVFNEYRSSYGISKIKKIIAGGDTRQKSSKLGLDAVSDKSKYIAIHDGARCLVTDKIIRDTVNAAYSSRAAAAASRVTDTVKISDSTGFIEKTVDRDSVWLVKTPQVFMTELYRAAAYMAEKDKFAATDDCMLAERLGFKVKLVECDADNIKITVADDIAAAESILERRNKK